LNISVIAAVAGKGALAFLEFNHGNSSITLL
jgi:hypothetical protein